ncbi:hypothetical protein [Bacillus altitudinis]|nr:hypothetical protein [Bacillus altitudinis]
MIRTRRCQSEQTYSFPSATAPYKSGRMEKRRFDLQFTLARLRSRKDE